MKIVIVSSWFPSPDSEVAGVFVRDQAEIIAKQHDVAVIAPWVRSLRKIFRQTSPMAPKLAHFWQPRVLGIPKLEKLTHAMFHRAVKKSFKELLKHWGRPDIIHAHVVLPGGFAAATLAEEYNIPLILTEHTGPFDLHLKTQWQTNQVAATFRKLSSLVAVSPYLLSQLESFQKPKRSAVIGNVVRDSFFTSTPLPRSSSRMRFVCLSSLNYAKGLDLLVEATRLIQDQTEFDFEVLLMSEGRDKKQILNLIKHNKVENVFTFAPPGGRQQVKKYIEQSHALILPSRHETFGLVLAEAMAMGKPVITTKCGGPEFFVTEKDGIIAEMTAESLAEAIKTFIKDSDRFDSQEIRRNIVDRFGEQAFLENISSLYEQLA